MTKRFRALVIIFGRASTRSAQAISTIQINVTDILLSKSCRNHTFFLFSLHILLLFIPHFTKYHSVVVYRSEFIILLVVYVGSNRTALCYAIYYVVLRRATLCYECYNSLGPLSPILLSMETRFLKPTLTNCTTTNVWGWLIVTNTRPTPLSEDLNEYLPTFDLI